MHKLPLWHSQSSWLRDAMRFLVVTIIATLATGCLLRSPRPDPPPSASANANQTVSSAKSTTGDASASSERDGKETSAEGVEVAAQPAGQAADVRETPQRPVTDDRAVSGKLDRGWRTPPSKRMPRRPADLPRTGSFALAQKTQWAPVVEERLRRGATRVVESQAAAGAMLMASARWQGTSSPLQVVLSLDGATLATGRPHAVGENRGGSTLSARSPAAGRARLSVTNNSSADVTVRITLGVLAP